jgi:hypothetical protein
VVAESLHLSIVALANGVPVFRTPAPAGSKYERLQGFDGVHLWRSAAELRELARAALGRGRPGLKVAEQLAQLEDHWDTIAGFAGARRDADGRLVARLSELSARYASDRNRLTASLAAAQTGTAALSTELDRQRIARTQAETHLGQVLATKSWRALTPIRAAYAAMRAGTRSGTHG